MTIANVAIDGAVTQVPALGGGFVSHFEITCTLTAAATHPLDPILDVIGGGSIIAAQLGPASVDIELDGGGASVQPYVNFSTQALEFRRMDTGAVGAQNAAVADPNRVGLALVVRQ